MEIDDIFSRTGGTVEYTSLRLGMRLVRFLLRYYPPGIILEYEQGSQTRTRTIDLLDLTERSNIYELVAQLQANEPLITPSKTDQV